MNDVIRLGHFVGAPAHAQAFDGVSIAENTYAHGTVVTPHAHDAALITLVLSGDSTEENRGRSRDLGAKTLLFTPAYETHGHRFRNAGRWLNIQVSDAWLTRVAAGSAPLPGHDAAGQESHSHRVGYAHPYRVATTRCRLTTRDRGSTPSSPHRPVAGRKERGAHATALARRRRGRNRSFGGRSTIRRGSRRHGRGPCIALAADVQALQRIHHRQLCPEAPNRTRTHGNRGGETTAIIDSGRCRICRSISLYQSLPTNLRRDSRSVRAVLARPLSSLLLICFARRSVSHSMPRTEWTTSRIAAITASGRF